MNIRARSNPPWLHSVAALVCDTGGTVFDWHSAVKAALIRVGSSRRLEADWGALAKTWRQLSTKKVDIGMPSRDGRATEDMDDVLLDTLRQTLIKHNVGGFTEDNCSELVLAWRTMAPWPDINVGLPRLRSKFIVAPFTILKTALVIEASRRASINWDAIVSCEMIGIYKTFPLSYATAAKWLDLPHERILLVTTHNNDLKAAHRNGFRTAFVYRPDEWDDIPSLDPEPNEVADIVAKDFVDLADQLGCSE